MDPTITISGLTSGGTTRVTSRPFASVAVTDSIPGDLVNATISFAAADGTLSGPGLSVGRGRRRDRDLYARGDDALGAAGRAAGIGFQSGHARGYGRDARVDDIRSHGERRHAFDALGDAAARATLTNGVARPEPWRPTPPEMSSSRMAYRRSTNWPSVGSSTPRARWCARCRTASAIPRRWRPTPPEMCSSRTGKQHRRGVRRLGRAGAHAVERRHRPRGTGDRRRRKCVRRERGKRHRRGVRRLGRAGAHADERRQLSPAWRPTPPEMCSSRTGETTPSRSSTPRARWCAR